MGRFTQERKKAAEDAEDGAVTAAVTSLSGIGCRVSELVGVAAVVSGFATSDFMEGGTNIEAELSDGNFENRGEERRRGRNTSIANTS